MVGAELTKWHGQAPRLPDKIKSREGYHIDNELDHARLTYTSQRRLICEGKDEGQSGRDQFFGEYKPPRINRRQGPVVFFSIDSTVYCKRKQKSK
jgi:hypothetical protein